MPDHSCLINVARGDHIVEEDLLITLEMDKLKKAYLDVFNTEPLPKDHPFWVHPKIFITSHTSGAFDLLDITDMIIHQCQLFYEKSLLLHPLHHGI